MVKVFRYYKRDLIWYNGFAITAAVFFKIVDNHSISSPVAFECFDNFKLSSG